MRIVVAGAGDLGTHLVQKLTDEDHEVSVIDRDQTRLDALGAKYDVSHFRGNVLSYDNLVAIGAPEADLFVAVSSSEAHNLMGAILAKRVGAKRVVARVRHSKLKQHDDIFRFKDLGLDDIVSPDALAASEVELLLDKRAFTDLISFAHGRFHLAGLAVAADDGFLGKHLHALSYQEQNSYIPCALLRHGQTVLIDDTTKAELGDILFFLANQQGIARLAQTAHQHSRRLHRAMILGGSRAGIETARRLQHKKFHVTLVDRRPEWAEELAEYLPGVLVICGSAQAPGFLEDHDIEEMDALIAATGDPEFNIVSSLIAKRHGVPHTVALVNDTHYLHSTHEFGVDKLIDKKLIAADHISRHVKKDNVVSVASLPGLDMEVLEFVVQDGSELASTPWGELMCSRQGKLILGGVVRDGHQLPLTNITTLRAGDIVVAACHNECRQDFQNLL